MGFPVHIKTLLARYFGTPHIEAERFSSNDRGAVILVFALSAPVLLAGAAAATDYAAIIKRRAQLQNAADGAALAAAKELTLASSDDRVASIAEAAANATLAMNNGKTGSTRVAGRVVNNRTAVQVTIEENIPFMMGHVLGEPSADVGVKAVAKLTRGPRRLCVVGLEPEVDAIRLEQKAKLTAVRCEVQSDSKSAEGIKVYNEALLESSGTCSAGGYKGHRTSSFSPTPTTDCPLLGDPLAKRPPPSVGPCKATNKVVSTWETLDPGTYCGGIKIATYGLAKLNPGIYVIKDGKLEMQTYSGLMGENVGFYFHGDTSVLDFAADTYVNLTAPKWGDLAGILFFEDRNAPVLRKFRILSDWAERLLGTIYLPRGVLYVGSNKPVASKSAYTVVVARQLRLDAGPDFILNSDYGSTDIPVPEGVGNTAPSTVSLEQ